MASYTCQLSTGVQTLSGTTIDNVTVNGYVGVVYVWNRSGATDLTVTVNAGPLVGQTSVSAPSDPVVGAAETFTVGPGQELPIAIDGPISQLGPVSTVKLKILGNGNTYGVRAQ